jgi:hypothetical protein
MQRAENLAVLGVRRVLELCVGPSLRDLERAYAKFGIQTAGNDIDPRWQEYYPAGEWLIGDATQLDIKGFDAVVVAPPLSKDCSGRREDALSLDQVTPSYYSFLDLKVPVTAYVLPGRTLSVKEDRKQLYRFLSKLKGKVEVVPLRKKVVKYLDIYVTR